MPSGHACQLCRTDRQLLAAADGLDGFNVLPDRLGKKTAKPGRESLIEQNSGPELALRNHNWRFIPGQAGDKATRRDLAELDRPSAAAGDRNLPPPPGQLYDLAGALSETKNVAAEHPKIVAEMKALLEKLVTDGRSTPGERQNNDVASRRFKAKPKTP